MADTPQSDSAPLQACPVCGHMNPPGALTCANCGTQLVIGGRPAETKGPAQPSVGTVITSSYSEVTPIHPRQQPTQSPAEPPPAAPVTNPLGAPPPAPTENPPVSAAVPPVPATNPPNNAAVPPVPATNPPDTSSKPSDSQTAPPPNVTRPIPELNPQARPPSSTVIMAQEDITQSSAQVCPNCKHVNRVGVLLCENCGTNLRTGEKPNIGTANFGDAQKEHDTLAPPVKEMDSPSTSALSTDEIRAVQTAGTGEFSDDMILRLEVEGAPTPILVYPASETVIGRRDPVTSNIPDVDLTAYAGYRMGVSRQHATLRLQNKVLDIRDLGSSNGTFVNGVRLSAHQPHPLRDGDELALGKMVLKVYFQSSGRKH